MQFHIFWANLGFLFSLTSEQYLSSNWAEVGEGRRVSQASRPPCSYILVLTVISVFPSVGSWPQRQLGLSAGFCEEPGHPTNHSSPTGCPKSVPHLGAVAVNFIQKYACFPSNATSRFFCIMILLLLGLGPVGVY